MSSASSFFAKLTLDDPIADVDGVKRVLESLSPGAVYEASYWSSTLLLRVVFNTTLTGVSQVLTYNTGATGLLTDTFSTWRPVDTVPISLANDSVTANSVWYTYGLVSSEGTPVSGTQFTLGRDDGDNALYLPSLANALVVNHPHTGSVSLSSDPIQGNAITLSSTLEDIDSKGSVGYVWQIAGSATDSEDNWTTVAGATSAQFIPTAEQIDHFVRVKVTYTDGLGYQETVISSVSNAPVLPNEAPLAVDHETVLPRGEAYTFKAADFPFSDPDSGDTLSAISLLNLPQTGQLSFNQSPIVMPDEGFTFTLADLAAGRLQFTPASGSSVHLQEELSFRVFDNKHTGSSVPGVLSLIDSSRPTGSNGQIEGDMNSSIDIGPSAYTYSFSDSDIGDTLTAITITQLPTHGLLKLGTQVVELGQTVSLENMLDEHFTYTPGVNGSGSNYDHFQYKISDGKVDSLSAYDLKFNVINPSNPPGSVDLAGQVTHWKGVSPVTLADVAVTVGTNTPALTDALGQFSLTGAEVDTGSPISAAVTTPFANKADAGITLTDVLATLKVYLGRELPSDYASPFNVVAADFDANGVVNLSDVLGLLKYYLGRTSAGAPVPTWAFVDAADVVSVNGQSKIVSDSGGYVSKTDVHLDPVSFTDAATPVHLIGVIRGDVDGSWAQSHAVL